MRKSRPSLMIYLAFVVAFAADGRGSRCIANDLAEPVILADDFGSVSAVAFSPDGKMLLTGTRSGYVLFWDVGTWKRLDGSYKHLNKIASLAFSPDGKRLATASIGDFPRPPELYIRDLEKYRLEEPLDDHEALANWCVAFSPDGKMLASGHESGRVKLWDVATRELIVTLEGHTQRVRSVAFSPDGKSLASGSTDGTIKLWNVSRRAAITSLNEDGFYVNCIAFSPDGARLATGGGGYDQNSKKWTSGGVRIWDVAAGKIASAIAGHSNAVRSMLFVPRGNRLISTSGFGVREGAEPGELRFSNVADGTERLLVKLPCGINSLALSPDEKFLAAGCDDGTARVWDVSGRVKAE